MTLPSPQLRRWTAKHKFAVVQAILTNKLDRETALARYRMSPEELDSWMTGAYTHNMSGLRVTKRLTTPTTCDSL